MGNINAVTWSPTYSVGVALIDEQHRGLLKLTNDLYNHCVGDPETERAYFKQVINDAVRYVKVHFSTEEQIMIKTGFPGYAEHKRQHEAFVLKVVDQVKAYEETNVISLLNFTHFLKDWILTHIAISDKLYFEYFKKIATRKDDGKLSITKTDILRYESFYRKLWILKF